MQRADAFLLALVVATISGCGQKQGPSTTVGSARVECDESVYPVIKLIAEDFSSTYPQASVDLVSVEGREAIANFINDSVQVIICGREFNDEERHVIATAKIDYTVYQVAVGAVAVIGHRDNPTKELRLGQLDSIFSGSISRWPGRRNAVIEVAVGGLNSSTNEAFRVTVLNNKSFTPTAVRFPSSEKLIEFVRTTPHAIGIVGLGWLKQAGDVTVFALDSPGLSDTLQAPDRFYPPIQAHIYRNYYPVTRPVYAYSREVARLSVGLGFVSYINSALGQKIFLNNGLVPATMPVRLVETTSRQVK